MERLTARGDFYDRQGRLLVETVKTKGINERRYKYNEIFFHPVGYWNKYGWKGGLEKELERYLINSERVVENPVRFEKKNPDIKKSKITLTIDKDIQMAAYEALGKYKGVVIIIAPESGEVLALVSKPAFNPNAKGIKNWNRAYHNEEESPFLNRALYRGYPPGSTFKVVVAAAAIESGAVELDDVFECRGEWKKFAIHDFGWHKKKGWSGHNLEGKARFNIKEALAHSCNVAYARIGLKLGKERLFEYARKFGFYKKFDLLNIKGTEFSSIKSVLYPEMSDPARIPPEKFTESHLAQTALGQYNVRTTPLQMALIAATIANKGILTDPHIVKKIELDGGKCLYSSKDKAEKHRVVREATASTLTDMMVAVMKRGTGKNAPKIYENGKRIWVAGKTGTAQINPGETSHSWFIGFAPADGMPKYAISVVAENSGSGASVATPIAINILKTLKVSGHSK
ncbi:MAG: hypothetical protein KKD21_15775 [Proteobacteria bacterium]|nr:hypothetical protein [Pseudomonadota bacterium]